VREVLDKILSLCELLEVRRPRDTALQERRRRHVGVQYAEEGRVESCLLGIGEGGWVVKREVGEKENDLGISPVDLKP